MFRFTAPWLLVALLLVVVGSRLVKPKTPTPLPPPLLVPQDLGQPPPVVSASQVFILDRGSQSVLYQKNAAEAVLPASTTKMVTALVALDQLALDQVITVPAVSSPAHNIGFTPGEKLTVEQLLFALLVQSGNDAAEILAGSFPGGRAAFVAAMNAKANQLHLTQTHFANPTGLDEADHYSTAVDLVRIADTALVQPQFAKIVATENAIVSTHVLTNINELLGKTPGVKGVKTGFTPGAGQALVTLVDRDGHSVILVVLGSSDRFADTQALIDWVWSNFAWVTPGS